MMTQGFLKGLTPNRFPPNVFQSLQREEFAGIKDLMVALQFCYGLTMGLLDFCYGEYFDPKVHIKIGDANFTFF